VSRIEGDGIKLMRWESLDDMTKQGQVGRKVGDSGDVLAFRKRDCDVKEQRISFVVFELGDLFVSAYEPIETRRKQGRIERPLTKIPTPWPLSTP
jgi:hypothetical protein